MRASERGSVGVLECWSVDCPTGPTVLRQKSHRPPPGSGRDGEKSFFAQSIFRIRDASQDLVARKPGIVPQHISLGPTFGDQFENKLNCEPRTFDDGLAHQHCGISGYVFLPFHMLPSYLTPTLRQTGNPHVGAVKTVGHAPELYGDYMKDWQASAVALNLPIYENQQ